MTDEEITDKDNFNEEIEKEIKFEGSSLMLCSE
jgi:hypothetical protein